MAHKFNIGQIVELEPGVLRSSAPGPYEIRSLVPASDRTPGDPCYRIKSIAEKAGVPMPSYFAYLLYSCAVLLPILALDLWLLL